MRKDKIWSYAFVSVIDDYQQSVTRIVRGYDLKPTTNRNRILQTAFGFNYPKIIHVPLVVDEHGQKLAKYNNSFPLRSGIHVEKQTKLAWSFLRENMPVKWIERVTEFTENYFF